MGNGLKAGRVVQLFGGQLWDRIIGEQFCFFLLFLTTVHLIPVSIFVFFRNEANGVSNAFKVVFLDGHEQLPLRHHR
jgi:hypothetical protein